MKKISFDYDGTLSDHFFGNVNPEKDAVIDLFVELFNSDEYDVYIITRRYDPDNSDKGLVNEHTAVYDMLKYLKIELPKEKILFTNRKYKFSWVNDLGIDIHLDDDSTEHDLILRYSNGSSVNVKNNTSWRKDFEELL